MTRAYGVAMMRHAIISFCDASSLDSRGVCFGRLRVVRGIRDLSWMCSVWSKPRVTRIIGFACVGFAALAWSLWRTRNKAIIEGIFFRHPADVMYKLVILLQLWKLLASKCGATRSRPSHKVLWAMTRGKEGHHRLGNRPPCRPRLGGWLCTLCRVNWSWWTLHRSLFRYVLLSFIFSTWWTCLWGLQFKSGHLPPL